jgi:hypothetical protein
MSRETEELVGSYFVIISMHHLSDKIEDSEKCWLVESMADSRNA